MNKRKMTKWKSGVLIGLLMLVMCVIPFYVSHADDSSGAISFSNAKLYVQDENGNYVELKNGDTLKKGQEIKIVTDWALDNESTGTSYSKDMTSDIENITIKDKSAQEIPDQETGDSIGTSTITNNSYNIELKPEIAENASNRTGYVAMYATVSNAIGSEQDGEEIQIRFGDAVYNVKYDDNQQESDLDVSKVAGNSRMEGGKLIQTFKVSAGPDWHNGWVKDISFEDIAGSGLSAPSNITITNKGGMDSLQDSYTSIDALNAALSDQKVQPSKKIEFTYDMVVDDSIKTMSQTELSSVDTFKNTIKASFTNNKGTPKDKSSSAYAKYNGPSVAKGGVLDSENGKVTWTVTVKLNDSYDTTKATDLQTQLATLGIDSILDTPGAGNKVTTPENLSMTDFTAQGGGVYTCTYTTDVTDELLDSVSGGQVSNTVELKKGSKTYMGTEGKVGIPGKEFSISKKAGTYDEATNTISWTIDIPEIPESFTGMRMVEFPDTNTQSLYEMKISDPSGNMVTVYKDGAFVAGNGIVEEGTNWDKPFVFSHPSDYYHKTIKAEVKTKVKNLDELYGKQYQNSVKFTYTENGKETDKNASDTWKVESAIAKSCKADSKTNTIENKIKVDLSTLTFSPGAAKDIVLKDQIPEGLKLSGTVKVQFGIVHAYWDEGVCGGGCNIAFDNDTNEYTFTMPGTQLTTEVIDTLKSKLHGSLKEGDDYAAIILTYTTKVSDTESFLENGEGVGKEYKNTVSGTYDGTPIGKAVAKATLTPQNVVTKKGVYDKDNPYPAYTVYVNPDKLDLDATKDTITLKDTKGDALEYKMDSIKVYDQSTNTELDKSKYSYELSADKKELSFTLPDEMSLRVEYSAKVIVTDGYLTDANNFNKAELVGTGYVLKESKKSIGTQVFKIEQGAKGESVNIGINKYWTNGEVKKTLKNSKFVATRLDNRTLSDTTYKVTSSENTKADASDGDAENFMLNGLVYDNIYRLDETAWDMGFSQGEPYYFYVKSTKEPESFTLADPDFYFLKAGETAKATGTPIHVLTADTSDHASIKYKNQPLKGTLEIDKIVSGIPDSVLNANMDKIQFTVARYNQVEKKDIEGNTYYTTDTSKPAETYETISLTDFTPVKDASGKVVSYKYELKEVPTYQTSAYKITEAKCDIPGYSLSVKAYEGTNAADATVDGLLNADGNTKFVTVKENQTSAVHFSNEYVEKPGSLQIAKVIKADATGDLPDWKKVADTVSFTVSSTDATFTPITVKAKADYSNVTYNATTKTLTYEELSNLKPGTYTITETIGSVEGFICDDTKTTFTDGKTNGIGTEGSVTVVQDKTANFSFANTYTKLEEKAKIILTKTISGADAASIEGTIVFHIESADSGAGKFSKDITLSSAATSGFKYDSKLKKWTYELDVKPGTYSITEAVSKADGYVLTKAQYTIAAKTDQKSYESGTKDALTFGNSSVTIGKDAVINADFANTYKEAPGKIIITKTIQGDVTKEEAEGALQFTVTNNTTNATSTYTLKNDFTYDAGTKTWSKELETAVGGYTVKESISDISGHQFASVTYKVDGKTQQNATATGVIVSVESDSETKVNITDSYEEVGKLVITKTIEGDVTKEEAEGALQFTVTNNTTKESTTYTLAHDFTYNATTKIWSKELDTTTGGYTVKETITDIEGKELSSVEYKIDGTKASENVSGGVTATVKKNGTTTVDITDSYEVTPTATPTTEPTETPEVTPTAAPTETPEVTPTAAPTETPEVTPTAAPTESPSATPTTEPTETPEVTPTAAPTETPEVTPTAAPTDSPSVTPTTTPFVQESAQPTETPIVTSVTAITSVPKVTKKPTKKQDTYDSDSDSEKTNSNVNKDKETVTNQKHQNPKTNDTFSVERNKYLLLVCVTGILLIMMGIYSVVVRKRNRR